MNKVVVFAFKGDPGCFVHGLLNVLDMDNKGFDAKIVIEGEAVKLIKNMEDRGNPLYKEAKRKDLIDCICKGCSAKMGVLEYNETVGIPLSDDMSGHPPMAPYIEKGYRIITL